MQYGPGIRALGVYLVVFQHLPYDRACQLLGDLAGVQLSTGSLTDWVTAAADGLCDFDDRLRELLGAAPVAHFDETGARIAGRLGWVHSASTDNLTRYGAHAKRGCEAIDAAGVLPGFQGVAVHDGWAPYRNYGGADHALCNIHHLRELEAAAEAGHSWPMAMSCLLLDAKDLVAAARAASHDRLGTGALVSLADCYQTIVTIGHEQHPPVDGKRTKAHNLLRARHGRRSCSFSTCSGRGPRGPRLRGARPSSAPASRCFRHAVKCEVQRPSRRSIAPISPLRVHASAPRRTPSLYSAVKRRRRGRATSGSVSSFDESNIPVLQFSPSGSLIQRGGSCLTRR